MSNRRFRTLIRLVLSLGSQSVASLATVILSILVARSVSEIQFGTFAIIIATWILVVGSIRTFTAELYVFEHSVGNVSVTRLAMSRSLSAGILLAFGTGALVWLFGYLIPPMTVSFHILSLGLPALVVQDSIRFLLVANRRPGAALAVDLLYVCLLVFALLSVRRSESLELHLIGWIIASYVAALGGLLLLGSRLSPTAAIRWIRTEVVKGAYFVGDFLITNGLSSGAVYMVALWGTVPEAGALRGTQVLLAPVLLIIRGASVALGAELRSSVTTNERSKAFRICGVLSLIEVGLVGMTVLAVYILPTAWLDVLLGESTSVTMELFPYAALATALLGVAIAPTLGLKAAGLVGIAFRVKLSTSPWTLALLVSGVLWLGAIGSQLALAAGEGIRGVRTWRQLKAWSRDR